MAFLIPDNLKSRRDAPEAVRKVAAAFEVGLDENATVWYEPPYDPSGEKPDLVVLLGDRGIVVLEVLDVKGVLGVLRGRVRIERDGREVETENPLARAERLAEILRRRIAAEPRLAGIAVPVGAGAVLGALTRDDARAKGLDRALDLDRCLFRPDIDAAIAGGGEAGLLKVLARMIGGPTWGQVPEEKEKLLRGIIQPDTVIDQVAAPAPEVQLTIFRPGTGDDDVIRVMDRQQEAFAKSLGDGHRVIRGVAGSGKTLLLVYRARLLARLHPTQRFLLTCYTRALAGQLRALLGHLPNVDVVHLDRLMADAIKGAGLKHPGYRDDESGDRVAEVAVQALSRGAGSRYRAVLIDEAQDFGTSALKFALGLLEPGHGDVVIVADAAQNIFRRKFSWREAGIQAQGRTRILRKNYRNTREILQFAWQFLLAGKTLSPDDVPDPENEDAVIPPQSAMRSGPWPTIQIVPDVRGEVEWAVGRAKEWLGRGAQPRAVGVLYPGSNDAGTERSQALDYRLRRSGCETFWLSNPQDPHAKDRLAEVNAPIVLSTVHSAKGIEFPYVVLCGLWRDEGDAEALRRLAYVGMTRATHHLAVVSRDGHPLAGDLRRAAGAPVAQTNS